jgi:large-conductance mechanosensitive channel
MRTQKQLLFLPTFYLGFISDFILFFFIPIFIFFFIRRLSGEDEEDFEEEEKLHDDRPSSSPMDSLTDFWKD